MILLPTILLWSQLLSFSNALQSQQPVPGKAVGTDQSRERRILLEHSTSFSPSYSSLSCSRTQFLQRTALAFAFPSWIDPPPAHAVDPAVRQLRDASKSAEKSLQNTQKAVQQADLQAKKEYHKASRTAEKTLQNTQKTVQKADLQAKKEYHKASKTAEKTLQKTQKTVQKAEVQATKEYHKATRKVEKLLNR